MSVAATARATHCAHCDLPIDGRGGAGGRDAREAALEPGAAFCCSGCYLAWHLTGRDLEGNPDRLLARLVLSAFLATGVMVFSLSLYGSLLGAPGEGGESAAALQGLFRLGALALSTPVMALLGLPLLEAVVRLRRWLSADALVLVGALAAWIASAWNTLVGGGHVWFDTATFVLVLTTLGRWLDARARERAHGRLARLAAERVGPARRVEAGAEVEVAPDDLRVGDRVRLRPGERAPVDGVVLEGRSFVDCAALTGEEQPRSLGPGDELLAGCTLADGSLLVRATAVSGTRVQDEIESLLREAAERRPQLVRVADRVAGVLLPLVLVLALATVAWHLPRAGVEAALLHGLAVLLISCPCALGIATPLAFWTALGEAWRRGALVRGAEVFERLARTRRVFLDKTGTLTSGRLELADVRAVGPLDADEVLRLAAALEAGSEHPVGRAIRAAGPRQATGATPVTDFRALPGVGVRGVVAGRTLELRRAEGAGVASDTTGATVVGLWEGGRLLGELRLLARARAGAREAVRELARRGLEPTILTGDAEGPARALGVELDVPAEARLLPGDKVARLRAAGPSGVLFAGEGLNDAAALAAADVGVSLPTGARPSLEAADVNLLRPDLSLLPGLVDLGRAAVRVARLNLAWAFAYNGIGLGLAVAGKLSPVFAASAMVVSSVLVVLNSARLARGEEHRGARDASGPVPEGLRPGSPRPTDSDPPPDRGTAPTLAWKA